MYHIDPLELRIDTGINSHLPQASSFMLDNGLKVIASKTNTSCIVCIHLYVKVGSVSESYRRTDPDQVPIVDQSSFSHFIEHLTFKSTASYPTNSISDVIPRLGGSINAYTDFDCTCYHVILPSEYLDTGLRVLSEIAYGSTWTEEDVTIEKDIIIEEIKQYASDPEVSFIEYIQRRFWPDHPLSRPILGTTSSIRAATHQDLIRFYRTYYVPNNSFLVITGDYDDEELHHKTSRHFSAWTRPDTYRLIDQPLVLQPFKSAFHIHHRQTNSGKPLIAVVLPELSEIHPRSDELAIATQMFCLGNGSILYRRMVEKEKLCSFIKAHSISGLMTGFMVILLFPIDISKSQTIVEVFFEELNKMRHLPTDLNEFDLAIKDLFYSWQYIYDSTDHLASALAEEEFLGGYSRLYEYGERIRNTKVSGVEETISQYWHPDFIQVYTQSNTESPILQSSDFFSIVPDHTLSPTAKDKHPMIEIQQTLMAIPPPIGKRNNLIEFHPDQYHFNLANGLRVILHRKDLGKSIGIALASSLSQLSDPLDKRGLNFLTSTALLYGSKHLDYHKIRSYSREIGCKIRISHQTDYTLLRAKCLNVNIEHTLALVAELFYRPAFNPNYIALIKRNVMDSIRRESDYPGAHAFNLWFRMLCGSRTNLHRASGSISDISKITHKDVTNWHYDHYTPGNFCLCLAGSFDPEQVSALCQKYFDVTKPVGKPIVNRPVFQISHQKRRIKSIQSPQSYIHLGGFGCAASDRRHNTSFHLLAQVLGGELNSRFYMVLREQYGYAYQCGLEFHACQHAGFWTAYAYCDSDDWMATCRTMHEILDEVCENGISADELVTAQNYLIGMKRLEEESVGWQASTIAMLHAIGYEPDYYFDLESRIREIDLDLIRSTARKWLNSDNRFLHVLH